MSTDTETTTPLEERRLRVVLDTGPRDAEPAARARYLGALLEAGVAVTQVGRGAVAPLDEDDVLVLGAAGAREAEVLDFSTAKVHRRSIAGAEPEAVVALVRAEGRGVPSGAWKPWFPVIDYDRCTNCMQCLSFCLFGVYDVDTDKRIDVAHPDRCKTNCPACSRVCPEVAILFPKYKSGPINGDVVVDADVAREKMKTDISSLLGGDIYALLRERHARASSRFSKERDEDRALKERQRCLAKLQAQLDIPEDVLASLPSAEAIQTKLAERLAGRDDET